MLNSYSYETDLTWIGRRSGQVTAGGFLPLEVSAPAEFAGDPDVWTPEHLLVAATASCLMTTFLAMADCSNLRVLSLRIRATGKLEKVPDHGYRFSEILLAPEIRVAQADLAKAERVLARAEKNCFITNSLRATVHTEPHFSPARAEAA